MLAYKKGAKKRMSVGLIFDAFGTWGKLEGRNEENGKKITQNGFRRNPFWVILNLTLRILSNHSILFCIRMTTFAPQSRYDYE
jgi:hypothetical protein